MNNTRRKTLQRLYNIIADAIDNVAEVRDEENDCKENIPENLWNSERHEKADTAADALEHAVYLLEEALYYIEEAMQ